MRIPVIYLKFWLILLYYTIWYGLKYHFIKRNKGKEESTKFINALKHQWAAQCLEIANIDITTIGDVKVNEDEKLVYVSNHQGGYDIPMLFYCLPGNVTFIAKKELFSIPVLGYWMRETGCIPMDRTNPRKGLQSVKSAVINIHNGMNPIIFPEGTRSRDPEGNFLPFKKGSLKVAIKSGAKVIPIAIEGTRKVFKKETSSGKIPVCVAIGERIDYDKLSKDEQKDFSVILQNKIEGMFQECRQKLQGNIKTAENK